ncbi:MAG: hypothetical protein CSA62_02200 [Planctomycetota bacterium]|nr:MAG: hypothetical protein CSA62_02200 [Planctomycetota bacterium]
MRAEQYINSLAANGRHHFTNSDAIEAIGGNDYAVRAQLRRLKKPDALVAQVRICGRPGPVTTLAHPTAATNRRGLR